VSDLLVLAERVRNVISLGESHFREFKTAYEGPPEAKHPRKPSAVARDIAEALVAFANADGGELLIGVEDDGTVTGVPHSDTDVAIMMNAVHTHVYAGSVLPIQAATKLRVDGLDVLFFAVTKGTSRVYQLSDGRCVRRMGTSTMPESVEQIQFDRNEAQSRAYDGQFIDGAAITDLDLSLVQSLADRFLIGITPERFLQQIGLVEYTAGGLRLRQAALLLFAKDISRWHGRSQVRVLKVAGEQLGVGSHYNVISDEYASGNVFELLVKAWELLRPSLAYRTEFGEGSRFEQKYIYPEEACREALVNAITHRDYSSNRPIEIYIFNDRMEVRSPGALLSTLSVAEIEKLSGAHESRNSFIARALREGGYVRELGEGMRRMFMLMEQNELRPPVLLSRDSFFAVLLFSRPVFSEKQEAWLDMFAHLNLSRSQRRIVAAGMNGTSLTPQTIRAALNTSSWKRCYDEIRKLRHRGILVDEVTSEEARGKASESGDVDTNVERLKILTPDKIQPPEKALPHFKVVGVKMGTSLQEIKETLEQWAPVKTTRFTRGRSKDGKRAVWVRLVAEEDAPIFLEMGRIPFKGEDLFFVEADFVQSQKPPRPLRGLDT
jgi:ATP-dependent DNA helicase RecG